MKFQKLMFITFGVLACVTAAYADANHDLAVNALNSSENLFRSGALFLPYVIAVT